MNPTKTAAIKSFLTSQTHSDLAELYSLDMECQVNVAQDGGRRVDGEFKGRGWQGWTDDNTTWKSFRIPWNAATTPDYTDSALSFELNLHAEGIGMTGWDWRNQVSRWVAFDFDAITGHSDKHENKLTPEQLLEIQNAAAQVPWITIRKSTGGKGLHFYVFLEPIKTSNHVEHAALARAILGKLSALTGFDFKSKVDVCGGNMWVWHRKMRGTDGLKLIHQGSVLSDVPINWRDHVPVITNRAKRIRARLVSSAINQSDPLADQKLTDDESVFEELSNQRPRIPLDDTHKRVLKFLLEENQTGSWWDADRHMLITHTSDLKKCHQDLSLRGIFDTSALGKDKIDHNCFAYPLRRGGWSIRRYGQGVQEHPSWSQDSSGFTRCYFNVEPDLASASKSKGALEDPVGGFIFREAEVACKAAEILGIRFDLPSFLANRETSIKESKDGRVVIEIKKEDTDLGFKDWLPKKGKWIRIFNTKAYTVENETVTHDDTVRHLVTETSEDYGWVLRNESKWQREPLVHVKSTLKSIGYDSKEIENIIGSSVLRCWKMVNKPFQPEYPGNREWNIDAAQLRFKPTLDENLKYPTWLSVLTHCGAGLDEAIKQNSWAKANGITNGADYLKIWLASLFKEPTEPLPYLFFYGPQNSGKSTFHEAASLLITKGYKRADQALINQSGFNGELEGALICVVEEINLKKHKDAANRIKDWVTARQISIHYKGRTPYHVVNSTHWIQASNDSDACPVFPGDTRITMIYVDTFDPIQLIPKRQLIAALEKEAPDFLAELLRLEIPLSNDRLNVPVITTAEKVELIENNKSPLERFIDDKTFDNPGNIVTIKELYEKFSEYLEPQDLAYWSKRRMTSELPRKFPKGRKPNGADWCIGNLGFTVPTEDEKGREPLVSYTTGSDQVYLMPKSAISPIKPSGLVTGGNS